MFFISTILYAAEILGICSALPIPSNNIENRSTIVVGLLGVLGIGAFLGACVCCRRRKRGFELEQVKDRKEFTNENVAIEAQRTEFPILRGLSPTLDQNNENEQLPVTPAIIVVNSQLNVSRDRLLDQDFDNNNGPISPADLENIENNNAVDYIPNRNEIGVIVETNNYALNRNIIEEINYSPENIILPSTSRDQSSSSSNSPSAIVFIPFENVIEEVPVQNEIKLGDSENNPFLYELETNSNISVSQSKESNLLLIKTPTDECFSLNSNSSVQTFSDINSVEEALRCLDIAIGDDDTAGNDDQDVNENDELLGDGDDVTLAAQDESFENVLRQFLIDEANQSKQKSENLDKVRVEATIFVDDLIDESEKIVENILIKRTNEASSVSNLKNNQLVNFNVYNTEIEQNSSINDAKILVNEILDKSIDYVEEKLLNESSDLDDSSAVNTTIIDLTQIIEKQQIQSPNSLKSTDSLENLFTENSTNFLDNTSTPFLANKMFTKNYENPTDLLQKKICHKLFDRDDSPITTTDENDDIGYLDSTPELMNGTYPIEENKNEGTFNVNDGTFKVNDETFTNDISPQMQAPPPPIIKIDRDETNSEDMTTVTPLNTPCELNYSLDSWDKFISNSIHQNPTEAVFDINQPSTSSGGGQSGGWFLHGPSTSDDTYEIEDEEDINSTYDALRKQLAEMLPHAQGSGMAGPADFSDEEDSSTQNDRTFEEYRPPPPNEVIINYKRPLSPIMEESEDETCKTFVMNETRCLDSTSIGCMESGEALLGVTKTLMASNDTLFNLEDTLGDDVFSPRANSQNDLVALNVEKSKIVDDFISTTITENIEDVRCEKFLTLDLELKGVDKKEELNTSFDLCSPDQVKTFSEEINSGERKSSSELSGTAGDFDATFTANTLDEKTCITVENGVIPRDDERISEISEPDWGSTASCSRNEANSLIDVPSLDTIGELDLNEIPDFEKILISTELESLISDVTTNGIEIVKDEEEIIETKEKNKDEEDDEEEIGESSSHDVSKTDEKEEENGSENTNSKSENESEKENNFKSDSNRQQRNDGNNISGGIGKSEKTQSESKNILDFLNKEIEFNSSQQYLGSNRTNFRLNGDVDGSVDNGGDNRLIYNLTGRDDVRIGDKLVNNLDIIRPSKYQSAIGNFAMYDLDGENDEHNLMVGNVVLGTCLSGEEDPWASPITDIRFSGPNAELMSTSFNMNEWESEEDDSNSSEEFMYVKGTMPTDEIYQNPISNVTMPVTSPDEAGLDENAWATHEDQIPVSSKKENEEESADDSCSDVEGEFVPSCWDSMATPARSALKSPDKSSSDEDIRCNKKRRNVAFKKQRYHSVYEYPREIVPLSPAYSEPQMWERDINNLIDTPDEFTSGNDTIDGFTISSSSRPFHGSQFHAQCNTWPTDSDFSWSQVQELNSDDHNIKYHNYSEIEWPQDFGDFFDEKEKDSTEGDMIRPDSGVGESAELLSESISLGELRHTKAKLRLPLNIVSVTSANDETVIHPVENKISDNYILPTPSCSGSMDSLSSSSGSERPISFSTFGKIDPIIEDTKHVNENDIKQALVLIEDSSIESSTNNKTNHDRSKRQSDSTDEDSGIENIMRFTK